MTQNKNNLTSVTISKKLNWFYFIFVMVEAWTTVSNKGMSVCVTWMVRRKTQNWTDVCSRFFSIARYQITTCASDIATLWRANFKLWPRSNQPANYLWNYYWNTSWSWTRRYSSWARAHIWRIVILYQHTGMVQKSGCNFSNTRILLI